MCGRWTPLSAAAGSHGITPIVYTRYLSDSSSKRYFWFWRLVHSAATAATSAFDMVDGQPPAEDVPSRS